MFSACDFFSRRPTLQASLLIYFLDYLHLVCKNKSLGTKLTSVNREIKSLRIKVVLYCTVLHTLTVFVCIVEYLNTQRILVVHVYVDSNILILDQPSSGLIV